MQNQQHQDISIVHQIESHVGVALICFCANWCKPCASVEKLLIDLKKQYKEKLLTIKIDVDEQKEITEKYQIKGVPTCIFFKNGQRIDSMGGEQPKFVFVNTVDELLASN